MRQLFWVLILLLTAALLHQPAAHAAERVLLTADGQDRAATAGAAALSASAGVQALRAAALKSGSVRVIVGLRVPFAPEAGLGAAMARQQVREIDAASTAVQGRFAAAIARAPDSFRSYASIPFIALEVTPAELDRLAADPDVVSLTPNMMLEANLDASTRFIRAPEVWASGYNGNDQTVAIIDTGVESYHPFLLGKVVSEACYSSSRWCPGGTKSSTAAGSGLPCPDARCDHGTHVAGIAAGYLNSSFAGVARGANLISIQVFSQASAGIGAYTSDIVAGLQRVYDLRNTFPIAAVNLSLGTTTRYGSDCDRVAPPVTAIIAQLRAAGIASVIASGNSGDPSGISFPACISAAVSVGSVSDRNWGNCSVLGISPAPTAPDMVACYSNASNRLTLLAPGSPIVSAVPGGNYALMHGTSMAAPHVAGAFALIRQKARDAAVDEIVAALRATGRPVTDYRKPTLTTPRIDVKAAIDSFEADDGRLPVRLTFAGMGKGTVTFTPPGSKASCAASCSSRFAPGTTVTLAAAPGAGMSFAGWAGACSGTSACTITVSAATQVTALFYAISSGPPQALSYTRAGNGSGVVSLFADGQTTSCDTDCTRSYGKDTIVRLTASAAAGNVLTSWSGACRGRKQVCTLRMSAAKSVAATFTALPIFTLSFTKAGPADGAIDINASDSVTTCTENCATAFPSGTPVRLTARPASGKSFTGWSGACRGAKATCTLRLRSSASVMATFN